jgi:RNA polymerase sigma factor (sigma-70 family)
MTVFANDDKLLRRFRAGDREALSTVYWHYVASVEVLLRKCLATAGPNPWSVRSSADLRDLLQDIFVKAFAERARLAYDERRAYRPFLMQIARNTLIDHLRSASREIQFDVANIDSFVASETLDVVDEGPWADPNTMVLVEGYVASLTDPERSVYLERYVRCRSQQHAAHALGMTRQQVRTVETKLRGGLARALAHSKLAKSPRPPRVGPGEGSIAIMGKEGSP